MRRRDFLTAGGALAASAALPAWAAYPEKPVRYIIAFAPGGESDIAARLQQQVWRKKWGQELVVESKPGAGGALAWSQLNGFPGDGCVISGRLSRLTATGNVASSETVLVEGPRTRDMGGKANTMEVGKAIAEAL